MITWVSEKNCGGRVVDLVFLISIDFLPLSRIMQTAYTWAVILFHRDDPDVLIGLNGERFKDMATFQDYLMKVDKTVAFPEQFFLAARLAMLMRGLALLLGLGGVSLAQYWKPEADIAVEFARRDRSAFDAGLVGRV